MEGTSTGRKKRDALFDNAKAILIFLVVFGHLISSRLGEAPWLRGIYFIVYMFHMPAFIFITGYFSKNTEKGRNVAVQSFLMPYILFNTLFALMSYFVEGSEKNFFDFYKITAPCWGMWFLLVVFIWKLLAKDLMKLRGAIPISFLLGLGLPFFRDFSTTLSLGRVFFLLFFFVAGLCFRPEWLEGLRRIPPWVGWLVFAACAGISYALGASGWMELSTVYAKSPYTDGMKLLDMLQRLIFYGLGSVMTLAFLNIVTRKKSILSWIGYNTITIYVLHLFIVWIFKRFDVLKDHLLLYTILSAVLSVALVFVLSQEYVRKGYDWVMGKINGICFRDGKEGQ